MKKDICIITGASSGLGFEIAKIVVRKGINLCIIARTEEKLDEAYDKLSSDSNVNIIKYTGNIVDEEFVKSVYAELINDYNIKYLFNVAGIGIFEEADKVSKAAIMKVFQSNLVGLIVMSTNALKYMKEKNAGYIINVMSSAAKKGNAGESVYCAAKWGARGYTESLISWSKGTGIKVMGVYPGGMNTNFWNNIDVDTSKFMDPKEVAEQITLSVFDKNGIKITDMSIDRV